MAQEVWEMKNLTNYYFLLTALTGLSACRRPVDPAYIKTQQWTHVNGFKIGEGDFVRFDIPQPSIFRLVGDTVYYNGKPRAIIVGMARDSMEIDVTSVDGKVKGEYRNVDESLR
jgi:hypothetical protein